MHWPHRPACPWTCRSNSSVPEQRRTVLYGTGEKWIDVHQGKRPKAGSQPLFRFQYKGLYPALEAGGTAVANPPRTPRPPGWHDRLQPMRRQSAPRRRRGGPVPRPNDRPVVPHASGRAAAGRCRQWRLSAREKRIAGELLREVRDRLTFLVDVGLDYLTLGRSAPTLSGGEAQRIRLASQVGSGLCGVLYVLDEPTIGLHPRDNQRLIAALRKLRDLGNTLLVVEHDRDVVASADRLLDFGPGAGRHGGRIVAQGTPRQLAERRKSVTGPYLSGRAAIAVPTSRRIDHAATPREPAPGLAGNHRRRHTTTCRISMCGSPSARSPSSPVRAAAARVPWSTTSSTTNWRGTLHRARTVAGAHAAIRGVAQINKVIRVDQRPFGNSPASNPATYTGVFELIRNLFAQLPEAKLRGYTPRRFSFNAAGGRCDACDGNGRICIEMHFLPDVWVECETCHGQRYQRDTLAVRYHGHSIADVLDMPCGEALKLFRNIPKIRRILATLCDVGLDYLTLGQPAPTLSGGEAQRVKLAAELARPDTGRTLYLLDEPTTGLHFSDLAQTARCPPSPRRSGQHRAGHRT